jgi:uncharacterized protein (DUF1330 family)
LTVYAVGQITVHDPERYARYASRFMDVLGRYEGRLLASDSQPRLVLGEWDREKVVILAFEDEAGFDAWWTSPEYREISVDRVASTTATVLLVQGLLA